MGWKCAHCGDSGPEPTRSPARGADTPVPTDGRGSTAAGWLAQGTGRGRAVYERARTRIRLIAVDPEETLVFRGDDAIGRAWPVDPHAGGGVDLGIDRDPTAYGLDGWDRVRPFVDAIVAGDPHFT